MVPRLSGYEATVLSCIKGDVVAIKMSNPVYSDSRKTTILCSGGFTLWLCTIKSNRIGPQFWIKILACTLLGPKCPQEILDLCSCEKASFTLSQPGVLIMSLHSNDTG